MAKKFSKTRCVHCLKYCEHLTSDHVFPKSWYPETTPEGIEKWQMPSCEECNLRMGKIENEILLKFGLCVASFDQASLGIAQRAMRSIKPEYGHNTLDAERRKQRRAKILKETFDPTTVPLSSIFPGFGFHSGVNPSEQLAVLVAENDLKALGIKLIRGITWVINKQYIEADHVIDIFFTHDPESFPFYNPLKRFGKVYSLGPGLTIVRAVADEDSQSGFYFINIWEKLFMYGCVNRDKKKPEYAPV